MQQGNTPASDIINQWATIEEAAVLLELSSRSIARRIKAGGLETRVGHNGRREVLVCRSIDAAASCPPSNVCQPSAAPIAQVNGVADLAVTLAPVIHSIQHVIARQTADVTRARRAGRCGWALAAALAIAAGGAIHWALQTADRGEAQAEILRGTVHRLSNQLGVAAAAADKAASDRERLRDVLETSRQAEARAEGHAKGLAQTAAILERITTTPSTQPASTRPASVATAAQ